jgi:hypothetical protein
MSEAFVPTASLGDAPASGNRRAVFIRWLRKMHGWIGLWGAGLGLLFGSTGIFMNHRAVLKIPAMRMQESNLQLPLPKPAPDSAEELADWLRHRLDLAAPASRVREEPAHPVAWGDRTVQQPEHWTMNFTAPRYNVQADWWVGNDFVSIKRGDNNLLATLSNLHKGVGMGVGWVLLVDTLAGSIILLSLTGVVLWTQLNRRRVVGAGIAIASLAITVVLALQRV